MVLRNRHEYETKGHPAIPMDAMVLWVDLADRLDTPHRICLIFLCLGLGLSTNK